MRRTDAAARTLACVATLLTVCAVDATAQLPWESPQLLGPRAPAGFSFIAIDYGLDPSPDLGGSIIYRTANAGAGFGIRGSVAPGFGDRVNVAAGLDLARPLVTASPEFPFDLMWTAGAGGSWGEFLEFALPLGVTLGTSVGTSSVRADPYMSARGAVEGRLGESAFGDRVSLALAVDVGVDVFIGRSRTFALRTAASLGDRHAAAIGLHVSPRRTAIAAHRTPSPRN